MPRPDLDSHFVKIDQLILDIDAHVPPSTGYAAVKLRADLAGLLVVTMAATYETCVKEVIHGHANRVHLKFGNFTAENFKKINSKININDLNHYCNLFDPNINQRFNFLLAKRKAEMLRRTGQDIEDRYKQILRWRHGFAHAWTRNATIEDVVRAHRAGKRVLYVFDQAFS
jgi:hypothetical protein